MATELIGIELSLIGEEAVYSDMQKLDKLVRSLGGRHTVELDLGNTKKKLAEVNSEIEKYNRTLKTMGKDDANYEATASHIEQLKNQYKELSIRAKEYTMAMKEHKSFGQMYSQITTRVKHLGSAFVATGNALKALGRPLRSLLSGTVFGAGYKLLGLMGEGFSRATSRADTLATYKPVFKALGAGLDTNGNWESQLSDAYDRVYESVVGLPTGVDEIVNEWKLLTIATQDYSKAADLAIASNNAVLASGADETSQNNARRELRTLMTTGKLTERQWDSLRKGISVSWNAIEQDLQRDGKISSSLMEALKSKEITAEQFGNLLIEEGINGKTKEVILELLHTYEAATANIITAFSNMGTNVLSTLDEVLKASTGKDTIDMLNGLKEVIDSFSQGVQDWIKANPEAITDFIDAIKSIDYASFFKGVGEGLKTTVDLATKLINLFGGKGLATLGKVVTLSSALATPLTVIGGLLKGIGSILIGGTGAGIGKIAQLFGSSKEAGQGGSLMKRILTAFGNKEEITEGMDAVGNAAPKMGKFSSGLSAIFKGWAEISTMVVGSAFVGWASVKLIKNAFKEIKELGKIVADIDWGNAATALLGAGDFIVALIGIGNLIGNNPALMKDVGIGTLFAGALTLFASGTFMADMALIKRGFKSIKDTTQYLGDAMDNLKDIKSIDDVGGVKTRVQNAITTLNQIIGLFKSEKNERNNPVTGEGSTNKLQNLSNDIVMSVGNLAESLRSIKSSINVLNEIGAMDIDTDGIERVIPDFETALSSIGTMLEKLPEGLGTDGTSENVANLSSTMGNLKSSFDSLIGNNGILAQIPRMVEQIKGMDRHGYLAQLPDKMHKIGDALREAYNALNNGIGNGSFMSTNMDGIREALKQARLAIMHLNKLGNTEVNEQGFANITTFVDGIKEAFGTDTLGDLSSTIDGFVQSIRDALSSFDEFNEEIEISPTIKLSSGFKRSVNASAKTIRSARGDIQSAINSIPSTYTKNITVRIIVNAVTQGLDAVRQAAQDAADAAKASQKTINESRGGYIRPVYRAFGGEIFKSRGTDTIPAMLTEGEFVHNRHATNFFGLDFMRRVNAMDVRGAMQALMAKAGNSTNIGRQSVVNNTVNNNQRVTQNIQTNNPSFAKMRAGRFAGAL